MMPTLKPVGAQSTNCTVALVLMTATAALTSLGVTSPRYIRQQAMYLPWRGSHLTIELLGSNTCTVERESQPTVGPVLSLQVTV